MPAICCDFRYQEVENLIFTALALDRKKSLISWHETLDAFVLLGCPQQRIQGNHLPPVFNLYPRALSTYVTLVASVYHSY